MTKKREQTVTDDVVYCSGDCTSANDEATQTQGSHPRVFIKIDPQTEKGKCPYCGAVFVKKSP